MDEWVQTPVWVPKDRIAEFYDMHARWLRRSTLPVVTSEARIAEETEERAWTEGPEARSIQDAIRVYQLLTGGAQKILNLLIDRPGVRMDRNDIMMRLGFESPNALTGTLASVGMRSRRLNRELPYRYEASADGGHYWMEREVATIFQRARSLASASEVDSGRYLRELESIEEELAQIKRLRSRAIEVEDSSMLRVLETRNHEMEARAQRLREKLALPQLPRQGSN